MKFNTKIQLNTTVAKPVPKCLMLVVGLLCLKALYKNRHKYTFYTLFNAVANKRFVDKKKCKLQG
jgi:hypothetical protein